MTLEIKIETQGDVARITIMPEEKSIRKEGDLTFAPRLGMILDAYHRTVKFPDGSVLDIPVKEKDAYWRDKKASDLISEIHSKIPAGTFLTQAEREEKSQAAEKTFNYRLNDPKYQAYIKEYAWCFEKEKALDDWHSFGCEVAAVFRTPVDFIMRDAWQVVAGDIVYNTTLVRSITRRSTGSFDVVLEKDNGEVYETIWASCLHVEVKKQ